MKPILYSPNETDFSHNGLGVLIDCTSCLVTEEANGIFELEMKYNMDGIHFHEITERSIIKAKSNYYSEPQLFRVYEINKSGMDGIAEISAQHISYDLSGIPVSPFSVSGADGALNGLKTHSVISHPFEFSTDKDVNSKFEVKVPASIRSRLAGSEGSVLDVFGGEYEFDNFHVILHKNRGMNRGLSIRYGKNLIDIEQERNCSNVYTGVYPFWADVEFTKVVGLLDVPYISVEGDFGFERIMVLDLSGEYVEEPDEATIRQRTISYIRNNNIGVPRVSLTVEYAQMANSVEYEDLKNYEHASLFDQVNVEFPKFGVSSTAKVVKIVYDSVLDRVESITLGSVRANISDTIYTQSGDIAKAPTYADIGRSQIAATEWLTNGLGHKVERRGADGHVIDTLYLDEPSIAQARNVLRIGQSGIGFSKKGVNGPYENAWTIDGIFNASFIKTGTISSWDGSMQIDLGGSGVLRFVGQDGNQITRIAGSVDGTGGGVVVGNKDGTMEAALRATNRSAGFTISHKGEVVAYLGMEIDELGNTNNVLRADKISCERIICEQMSCSNLSCSTINGNPV